MRNVCFGLICENCERFPDVGIIRGPGEYRAVCPVCDGVGRLIEGHPTQYNLTTKGMGKNEITEENGILV